MGKGKREELKLVLRLAYCISSVLNLQKKYSEMEKMVALRSIYRSLSSKSYRFAVSAITLRHRRTLSNLSSSHFSAYPNRFPSGTLSQLFLFSFIPFRYSQIIFIYLLLKHSLSSQIYILIPYNHQFFFPPI